MEIELFNIKFAPRKVWAMSQLLFNIFTHGVMKELHGRSMKRNATLNINGVNGSWGINTLPFVSYCVDVCMNGMIRL